MVAFKPKAASQQVAQVQAQPTDLVVVARIGVAYGIKGWVKLHPFSRSPDALESAKTWWIAPYLPNQAEEDIAQLSWISVKPVTFKSHSDVWVAQFNDWTDRSDAEKHKGWQIAVSRADFPAPNVDEFYWVDMVGAQVINQDGVILGRVESLLENTAQTVMQIGFSDDKSAPEYLIPFVAAFVGEVDLKDINHKTIQVTWDVEATA